MAKQPTYTLTLEDWNARVTALMIQLQGKTKATGAQITEMFFLHNDRLSPFEVGRYCGTCRERVRKRLLNYYATNILPNETINKESID